jgi:two-component system, NtrC family, sensor kinase
MSRICFYLVFFLPFTGRSQFVIPHPLTENVEVNSGIYYLEDKKGELTIHDATTSANFKPVESGVPNFGISGSTFWLRLLLVTNGPARNYLLQVSQPALDEIDFYQRNASGELIMIEGGERVPFGNREFFDPNYIYRLKLDSGKVSEIYLRISAWDNLKIPIIIGTQESIFETNKTRDFILGIFAGIMVVMFLYNLFLYVTVRDKTYLYYIAYLATVILTQVSIQGYTFQYLWPGSPFMAQWSPFIFSPLVGLAAAYFMRLFLNTPYHCPGLDKGLKFFVVAYSVSLVFAFIGIYHLSYLLITLTATAISLYMFAVAVVVFRKKYKPARFFLLAWSLFLFGVTIYAMTNLGVLPLNNFTFYTMPQPRKLCCCHSRLPTVSMY